VEWELKRIEVRASWVNAGGMPLLLILAIFAFTRDITLFIARKTREPGTTYMFGRWFDAFMTLYVCWVAFELVRKSQERTLNFAVCLFAIGFVAQFLLSATTVFGAYVGPVRIGHLMVNTSGWLFLILFSGSWLRARVNRV
jgi:hypothetical protein